jgi:hypothetical protein
MTPDLIKDLCAKVLASETNAITETRIAAVLDRFLVISPDAQPYRESILRALRASFSVTQDSYQILEDPDTRPRPWLTERRASGELTWAYWHRYRLFLEKKLAPEPLNQLDNLTNDILDRLTDPRTPGAWDRRGMVVGQVQSGKTGNYIGLINKAVDAGYRLVIVLAGIHDSLRAQTQVRVDEGFLGYSVRTEAHHDSNLVGVGKLDPAQNKAQPITTSDLDGDFSKKSRLSNGANLKAGVPNLLVIKKNAGILRNLIQWLATWGERQPDGTKLVRNLPLLLIDDEADNASVNVSRQAVSTINGLVRALLALFEQSAYVGYTATPFANIFIPILDEQTVKGLSPLKIRKGEFQVGQDLFPGDFIINLPAPSNYFGPARLFGLPTDDPDAAVKPLPVVVNLSDPAGFAADYARFVPDKHKKDDALPTGLPPSLAYAVRCFLLVCAARKARGQTGHNSMLVHVSRFIRWQDGIARLLDAELKSCQRQIEFNQGPLRDELRSIWEREFVPTTRQIIDEAAADLTAYQDPDIQPLPWEAVEKELFATALKTEVRAVHGDTNQPGLSFHNVSPLDYAEAESEKPPRSLSVIAVGGEKLSRGLTLEGLSISYYLRASKMYDTLMQMGRWFGYRPGYADLCRLFTSGELVEWYRHITVASEEVRRDFERMVLLNRTPREFGLKVRTHPGVLKITAVNKFREHRLMQLSYSGELEQTRRLKIDERRFRQNLTALETLLAEAGAPVQPPNAESARRKNLVFRTDEEVVREFLSSCPIEPAVVDTAKVVDYIRKQTPRGDLTDWTVVLVNNTQTKQKHTFTVNGQPTEVGLTRRANVSTSPTEAYEIAKAQVISPPDEFTDLNEKQLAEAYEETKLDWAEKKKEGEPKYPSTFRIKRHRPSTQGLLLIYPLDPVVELSSRKKKDPVEPPEFQTLTTMPVVAFAVSFPEIEQDEKVEYAVNQQFKDEYDYDDTLDELPPDAPAE